MAKEQLAVIEMITNMILGKTNGVSKVDFTHSKIPFPENLPYDAGFPARYTRGARVSLREN